MNSEAVLTFLRDEFHDERLSGFARLRRIPSVHVRKFIDYFAGLDESLQDELADALAQTALCLFIPSAPHPHKAGSVAYERYRDAMALMGGWRYGNVRRLKMRLAELENSSMDDCLAHGITPEILAMMRAVQLVQANEIRRVVKLALSQFCPTLTIAKKGGGVWDYQGVHQELEFCVTIDYGGRSGQLRYEIYSHDRQSGIAIERLSFEGVMGLSFAAWDCLEQKNLDQSVALLKELVRYCVELPKRLN